MTRIKIPTKNEQMNTCIETKTMGKYIVDFMVFGQEEKPKETTRKHQ